MLGKRELDPAEAVHFRADRISNVNGAFYFSTREHTLEGPFPTRAAAELESQAYIARSRRATSAR
ncbi:MULTISPECIES: DUF6316 family protein [unclassified Pseudomonas]|uniref:DUF6316 family protein n=1 Tax=unclassified Pseudomonas TaxID=196821 RepID=UPI000BCC80D8|nr:MULTISPECIES: DUF6316 family protein [unclassified Pseudomonas]PVZ20240.1 hypothetical protein F474_00836 [Pseudomonas sp. URIL14HWK12:I12]PVZ27306.1 hypothetical protein F470_00491 [Pseudomonas sp. URIL14HWK12:I10]PVZ38195.1 hypothetical protein F472_00836 [Pseudomonas sp. URIL14HWK12:I11]SNZ04276.1 hypothetical protein SAMN05660463_00568 [Pseudomonas sp. URIL14HWK12:I9]